MMSSHISSVTSRMGMRFTSEPALFTRMSMGPNSLTTCCTTARISVVLRKSPTAATAVPPAADIVEHFEGALLIMVIADGDARALCGEQTSGGGADA